MYCLTLSIPARGGTDATTTHHDGGGVDAPRRDADDGGGADRKPDALTPSPEYCINCGKHVGASDKFCGA